MMANLITPEEHARFLTFCCRYCRNVKVNCECDNDE